MYLQHFGFERLPFESRSSGAVFVDLPEHRDALNTVLFGLRSGEGFVKIVGEVGTGKTVLCRNLLSRLGDEFTVVDLPNPAMRPHDLIRAIAEALLMPLPAKTGIHDLRKYTHEILLNIAREGGRVAIFVDEAQTMPPNTLEELRLLSNLENERGRLSQAVLFGQPELDVNLSHYSMRQLSQRIAFGARLTPVGRKACHYYIQKRMAESGASTRVVFNPGAIDRIHDASGGILRLINTLGNKSLIAAFTDGDFQVSRRHVARAVADTEGLRGWKMRPLFNRRRLARVPNKRAESSWNQL